MYKFQALVGFVFGFLLVSCGVVDDLLPGDPHGGSRLCTLVFKDPLMVDVHLGTSNMSDLNGLTITFESESRVDSYMWDSNQVQQFNDGFKTSYYGGWIAGDGKPFGSWMKSFNPETQTLFIAGGATGINRVSVTHPLLGSDSQSGVFVNSDGCHPITEHITLTLQ